MTTIATTIPVPWLMTAEAISVVVDPLLVTTLHTTAGIIGVVLDPTLNTAAGTIGVVLDPFLHTAAGTIGVVLNPTLRMVVETIAVIIDPLFYTTLHTTAKTIGVVLDPTQRTAAGKIGVVLDPLTTTTTVQLVIRHTLQLCMVLTVDAADHVAVTKNVVVSAHSGVALVVVTGLPGVAAAAAATPTPTPTLWPLRSQFKVHGPTRSRPMTSLLMDHGRP
jgi:hypothetical protein